MTRLEALLEKRGNLTATLEEELELLDLAKTLPKVEFNKLDPKLLVPSNEMRLDKMVDLLDKLIEKIDGKQ